MNELKIFENEQFGKIRVIEQNGEPWFVAADVCRALDIDPTATRRLDDDEKDTLRLTQGTSGNPNVTIVNEPGLYSLVLGSRKPEAKAFKRWITHEVIPSIRKTGSYTFDGTSKELQAIFMLDNRTVQHEQRISALEERMVVDYGQQRTLASQVNAAVIEALGGMDSPAYCSKNVRGKVYSECNRDIQKWFRVNSRNNIPRKRFDEACEYIQRWRPSVNTSMIIRQTNQQTRIQE